MPSGVHSSRTVKKGRMACNYYF